VNPEQLRIDLTDLGLEKARSKAMATSREHGLKATKAVEYGYARRDGASQGDAEQLAYASDQWKEAAKRYAESVEAAEIAIVQYQALLTQFEAWRTLESTKRAEMGLR